MNNYKPDPLSTAAFIYVLEELIAIISISKIIRQLTFEIYKAIEAKILKYTMMKY